LEFFDFLIPMECGEYNLHKILIFSGIKLTLPVSPKK